MGWEPIVRLGGPRNMREHRMDAALVTIEVELSRTPPDEWMWVFEQPPGTSRVIHELRISGDRVTFTAEAGEDVAAFLADVDERIRAANLALDRGSRG